MVLSRFGRPKGAAVRREFMTRPRLFILPFLALFFAVLPGLRAQDDRRDPFRVEYRDAVVRAYPGEAFGFDLKIKIPDDYWLYDEKTSLLFEKTEDLAVLKSERPAPVDHFDPFLKKNLPVFFKELDLKVFFMVPK
ncbi:hypothetical protein F9K50_00710 [bacterium]|nr:MAG: hypothetical protein F9K50_00710 [bacterium]